MSNSIKKTSRLSDDITLADMYKLTTLTSESRRARSLEGLEHAKNLGKVNISIGLLLPENSEVSKKTVPPL
ncbi:hypothetical protein ACQKM9_10565 [Viridibacillus sp. NPDC093762]|uniref:hypothetical protein n=1 Tax=Viridibacillus sp. NPDC093762 TaxID=3390720 RepID=UPI003CFF5E55